jgi:hypothetical protein
VIGGDLFDLSTLPVSEPATGSPVCVTKIPRLDFKSPLFFYLPSMNYPAAELRGIWNTEYSSQKSEFF